MKWIKIAGVAIAALIVLPVLGLAIANVSPDSNRLQGSIVIHQKPAAIWPYLYQPDKVKTWVSWMVDVRNEVPEPTVGRNFVWVMEDHNNGNARMEIKSTWENVEPNHLLAVHLTAAEGFSGNATYTLTALPDGTTRVESDSRYQMQSAFVRFMMPLVCWQARKKMMMDLEQLRSHVEGGI